MTENPYQAPENAADPAIRRVRVQVNPFAMIAVLMITVTAGVQCMLEYGRVAGILTCGVTTYACMLVGSLLTFACHYETADGGLLVKDLFQEIEIPWDNVLGIDRQPLAPFLDRVSVDPKRASFSICRFHRSYPAVCAAVTARTSGNSHD
jgi:hypothetical protein